MEGRGVRRTRDEMEGEAVAPVVQTPLRGEVATRTVSAVRPAAVRHDVSERPSGRWTLDSPVEDVLMEDCGGLDGMRLHDFLMKYFKRTFGVEDTSMCVFMDDPSLCVSDESVLRWITNSSPYREFVEDYEIYKTMREGVDRLSARGIFSLLQWARAEAANEVRDVNACVRGMLNAAILSVRRYEEATRYVNAHSVKVIDGVYDSVFNARWSYVVRSDEYGEGTLGMGVLRVSEGEQPHLWSEAQADIKPEPDPDEPWEGDVVPGVEEGEQPSLLSEEQADVPYDPEEPWEGDEVPGVGGKLVMATLKSQKGWPYMLFNANKTQEKGAESLTEYNAVCDAYIRRENLRVWHIVKKGLDEWLNGVKEVHPFIVISTPGIGKSFATGSVLLYQMLHYKSEDLKVVAY
ncbi:unnamed protein product, partial [Trypanosoma congolense IL3000]